MSPGNSVIRSIALEVHRTQVLLWTRVFMPARSPRDWAEMPVWVSQLYGLVSYSSVANIDDEGGGGLRITST